MRWFKSLRLLFALQTVVGVMLVVGSLATSSGIIQFRYPQTVENEPLLSPVAVTSLTVDKMVLGDGRIIEDLVWTSSTEPRFTGIVDIEEIGDDEALIYVKHRGWLCGTPWAAAISIPLFADEIQINHRVPIARGRLSAASDGS